MTDPSPRSPSPRLGDRLPALHPSTHPHVFELIAAHADRPTLVSLARTSQEMHLLLAPQLYHTVDLRKILPYNPREPRELDPSSLRPCMWLQFQSWVREVIITEHDADICARQLQCVRV